METQDFLINNLSYSQLRTFISNTGEWQNQRLLWIYDNTMWIAGTVGSILHIFVENYLKNGGIESAIDTAYKCLYEGEDGNTYLIDEEMVWDTLENVKNHWKTKVVDFGKTWSNEKILKQVKSGIEAFLSEEIDYGELLYCELKMEYDVSEKLWKIVVNSPIPFVAIADEVCRTTSQRTIMVDGSPETLESWAIFIEDTKFKGKHSEMNEEDPKYIFQAMFNYYCAKQHFWEAPKFITFREIKTSANKDWSSQHQTITIPFFWKVFEEYKVYFWRYIIESFERIKIIQERDFLFNIFDIYNWPKEWEKQKAYYLWVEVWQLKSKIAQTSKNKHWNNVPVMWDRDPLLKMWKKVKWEISDEDLYSTENKIRTAFRNFGVIVQFEKKIEGYSFDQYLFTPARWITMWKIKMHLPEIIQALEVEKWLRIEAPVLGTKFIGVEIPKEERRFAKLEKFKKSTQPLLPIWISVDGKEEIIDLSDSDTPHVIVAWQTWSWKSEFLKTAIHCLKDKWKIYLIDPKRTWLIKFKNIAEHYETNVSEIALQLDIFLAEMYKVYDELAEKGLESIYEASPYMRKNKFRDTFIIIDELASLAHDSEYGKDIIATIWQLANLWRAAGFHLIVATQRPDIKVIPGNIKANISTRVCFALATKTDSKVVIDEEWAEQLLGKWDMLFMNRGIKRLQGFYI